MVESDSSSSLAHARREIEDVAIRLDITGSAIRVVIAALREQNCELDEDVACVLQRSAVDRIFEQAESLRGVLNMLRLPDGSAVQADPGERE